MNALSRTGRPPRPPHAFVPADLRVRLPSSRSVAINGDFPPKRCSINEESNQ